MTDERKLELVKEAIKDCRNGKLNEFSAIIAISLIVDPQPQRPSKEFEEWIKKIVAKEYANEN